MVLEKLVLAVLPAIPRPIMRRLSARYIAGETLGEAIDRLRTLSAAGFAGVLDILGEDVADEVAALLAHAAQADEAAVPESEARSAARWRGQRCTPAGCTGTPANPWSVVVGFGEAALAAGWIGRRLSGPPRSSDSSWTSREPGRPNRVGSSGHHPLRNH